MSRFVLFTNVVLLKFPTPNDLKFRGFKSKTKIIIKKLVTKKIFLIINTKQIKFNELSLPTTNVIYY